MKKGLTYKTFVCFLSVSFLLLMNEFPKIIAEANPNIPVAQMISRGGVKFEVKENSWLRVETPFPVFEGMRIRTEKGEAVLALAEKTRIEIGSESLFHFGQRDEFHLHRGKINFSIQPDVPLRFKVGHLRITKSYPLQSAKGSSVVLMKERAFAGSILMHSNGSVTVKSVQGLLSVTDERGAVLASLSTGESITLPSDVAGSKSPIMIANAEPKGTQSPLEEEPLLSKWETWVGIGSAIGVFAAMVGVGVWIAHRDHDDHERPACP
ncbi:MAG: hypothetical protein ACUVWO_04810 [Thermodesulfobacteriota bacterium]